MNIFWNVSKSTSHFHRTNTIEKHLVSSKKISENTKLQDCTNIIMLILSRTQRSSIYSLPLVLISSRTQRSSIYSLPLVLILSGTQRSSIYSLPLVLILSRIQRSSIYSLPVVFVF